MEKVRYIFWEAMKVLSLVFLGVLAAKGVASLPSGRDKTHPTRLIWIKGVLYSAILALVILGAWNVGFDVAAESYSWASQENLERGEFAEAYMNAVRAVRLRPGVLRYWRELSASKVYLGQFESVLDDLPAFRALEGGNLDEEDSYRFVACCYYLAQYDKVISSTQQLIRQNSMFAAPYVLQGQAYAAQKKYPEAIDTFQAVLRIFPTHQAAVEGLARAYFLAGDRARALEVLNEAARHPVSPEARKRFEALKGLYGQ